MKMRIIPGLCWVILSSTLLSAWTFTPQIECKVQAKIYRVIPRPDVNRYDSIDCRGAIVKYYSIDALATEYKPCESNKTNTKGTVRFLVVKDSGTKLRFIAAKTGNFLGTADERYINEKEINLNLKVIEVSDYGMVTDTIKSAIESRCYEKARILLKEFERFFPEYRNVEQFQKLKELELELKEKGRATPISNPGASKDFQEQLRNRDLERIRTGKPGGYQTGNNSSIDG